MKKQIRLTESQLYAVVRQTIYEEVQKQKQQELNVSRITEGIIKQLNEDKRIKSFEDLADAFGEQATLEAIGKYTPWFSLSEDLRHRLILLVNQQYGKIGKTPLSDDTSLHDVVLKFRKLFKNPYKKIIKEFDKITRGYYDYPNWIRQIYKSYIDDYSNNYGTKPCRREDLKFCTRAKSLKSLEDKLNIHPDLARLIGQDESDIRQEANCMGTGEQYGDNYLKDKKKILYQYARHLRNAAKKC